MSERLTRENVDRIQEERDTKNAIKYLQDVIKLFSEYRHESIVLYRDGQNAKKSLEIALSTLKTVDGISLDRLRELAKAVSEERFVVLPKVGDKLYYAPYPKGAKDCRGELFFLRNCGDGSGIVKSVSVTVKFDNWSSGVPLKKTWKTLQEAEAAALAQEPKGEAKHETD